MSNEGYIVDTITPKLQKLGPEVLAAARKGLFVAAEHVLGESNEHVPFENGDFMRTGGVSVDDIRLIAAISYRDYAFKGQSVVLHEKMNMRHDEGRHAKFLEKAINSERKTVRTIVISSIRGGIGT